jgi:molecular chaperone DnaJ
MPSTQTKPKDYYAILGVDRKSDEKAIKAALRKLARKFHPDVNPGDAAAEERFKQVNEAFNVLSEGPSRKLYDRYGADWERYREAGFTGDEPAGPVGGTAGFDGFFAPGSQSGRTSTFTYETDGDVGGLSDFMQSVFSGRRRPAGRFTAGQERRRRGDDLDVSVEVSFDEAFKGTSRRIDIQTPEVCPTCGGTGYARQAPCPTCDATGTVDKSKTIEVKIPAGVATGSRVRVAGQGGSGIGGGPKGDVWLNVTVRPDRRFERAGDDLKTELEVPLYAAVLGGEIVVPTPTGRVALAVPAGSQNGRQFRLRGQGMPRLKNKDGGRGDLLARIKVAIPENLTDQERSLFEQLRTLRPDA